MDISNWYGHGADAYLFLMKSTSDDVLSRNVLSCLSTEEQGVMGDIGKNYNMAEIREYISSMDVKYLVQNSRRKIGFIQSKEIELVKAKHRYIER